MAGTRTGLQALREMRDAAGVGGGKGSGIWKLWLKDGERAQFWFANDGDDIMVPLIHLVPKKGANGRSDWTKDVACAKTDYDDETYCALCEDDTIGANGKRAISPAYPRLVCLAYVTAVYHPTKNPKTDGTPWEPIEGTDGKKIFKETVNDFRLVIAKLKLQKQIEDAFAGDPADEDYGTRTPTLQDRPYQLVKSGSGQQSQETLRPGKLSAMPAEVREAIGKAPSLAEVIEAEFSDGQPRAAARTGSGQRGYDPDEVGEAAALPDEEELENF